MKRGEILRKEMYSLVVGQLPSINLHHQHWKKTKQNDTNKRNELIEFNFYLTLSEYNYIYYFYWFPPSIIFPTSN
jgi:hypothetical protein